MVSAAFVAPYLADTTNNFLLAAARTPGVRDLSDAARARLDRVLPALLQHAAASDTPDAVLRRVLPLLHTILRRASYLALLDEQPAALARLASAPTLHTSVNEIQPRNQPQPFRRRSR